jgi:phenol hydroxylase P5 protein
MSYELTIEPLGQTIEVEEGQTILDAALRAGIWLPHACCHGLCATCKVQVVDGEVDHGEASSFALMDFERTRAKPWPAVRGLSRRDHRSRDRRGARCRVDPGEGLPRHRHPHRDAHPDHQGHLHHLDEAIHFQAGQYINLDIPGSASAAPSPRQCARAAARWSSTSASCRAASAPPTSMNSSPLATG